MKAISLKQPWAYLMVHGWKMPEFRKRPNSFRGECYIHASKTIDKSAFEWIATHLPFHYIKDFMPNGLPPPGMFNTGKVIGKLRVIDCLPFETAKAKYPLDIWLEVANGELGKYAFITELPKAFPLHEQFELKGTIFPLFFEVDKGE